MLSDSIFPGSFGICLHSWTFTSSLLGRGVTKEELENLSSVATVDFLVSKRKLNLSKTKDVVSTVSGKWMVSYA